MFFFEQFRCMYSSVISCPHQGLLKKDEFVKEKNLWENFVAEIYFVNKCVSLTPPVSLSHQLLKYSADWKTVSESSQQKTINKCYFHKILRRNVFLSRLLLYSQPSSAFTVLSEPCNVLTFKTVEKKKMRTAAFTQFLWRSVFAARPLSPPLQPTLSVISGLGRQTAGFKDMDKGANTDRNTDTITNTNTDASTEANTDAHCTYTH